MIKTASGALVPALLASLAIGSLVAPAAAQPADATPKRQAFFGDLHLHTSYSFDAWAFGTKTTPDEAYRFAKGQTLDYFGKQIRRPDGPLDFMAVTDHSEYIGVLSEVKKCVRFTPSGVFPEPNAVGFLPHGCKRGCSLNPRRRNVLCADTS